MGQAGAIDTVIFGRPDRLGRDGPIACGYYIEILRRLGGIEIRFGRNDIDPQDPDYERKIMQAAMKGQDDAETIKENTMEGRRERANDGLMPNGSFPWPYDYESKAAVGGLRAYPNNPAARKAIKAQAKCRKAI